MKRTILSMMVILLCAAGAHAAKKNNGIVKFNLYGSDVQIRFDASKRVKVKKATDAEIDKYFKWLDGCIDQTLQDCQKQKQELELCDWAYLKMLDKLSTTALGQGNEATLLMAGLLGASGYSTCVIRFQNGQLRTLYHTDAFVYNQMFFTNNNKQYFMYGDTTNISGSAKIVMTMEKSDGKMIDFRQTPVIKAVTLSTSTSFSSIILSILLLASALPMSMSKVLLRYWTDAITSFVTPPTSALKLVRRCQTWKEKRKPS